MRRGKRTFLGILAILLCILSGCGSLGAAGAREQTSLWVLTEQSTRDGMNLQAEIIAERMEKENPGLTVQLDILPTDPQEREIRLKRLRTKIMAGDGPDVYLLPTGNRLLLDDDDERAANISTSALAVEPLFFGHRAGYARWPFRGHRALLQSRRRAAKGGLSAAGHGRGMRLRQAPYSAASL